MLSLVEEDVVYLEDPEDHLRLDLSPLQQAERGFYLETMLVVVGGRPNGDSFLVDFICPPPTVQSALLASSNSSLPSHGVHLAPDPVCGRTMASSSTQPLYNNICGLGASGGLLFRCYGGCPVRALAGLRPLNGPLWAAPARVGHQ